MPARRDLSPAALVGQLAEPDRLRVVAALVLGARTPSQIAAAADLSAEAVTAALTRLVRSGLVRAGSAQANSGQTNSGQTNWGQTFERALELDAGAFARAARAAAPGRPPDDFGTDDPEVVKVLRAFLVDGRLAAIPAPGRKRRVVLEYLAAAFEPGVRYPEAEVDTVLRTWHIDHAALRRYLVEEGFLTREAGLYWRSGGWVDLS